MYTEEKMLEICQYVAEKLCANSISLETIKSYSEDYG